MHCKKKKKKKKKIFFVEKEIGYNDLLKKKHKSFVGETELGYNAFYKTSIHNRAFGCELRASFPFANV
jgi:hypothetical protein